MCRSACNSQIHDSGSDGVSKVELERDPKLGTLKVASYGPGPNVVQSIVRGNG